MADSPVEQIVDAVLASSKYRHVSREFVRNLGADEFAKRRNLKEAIKATKNKLHQVAGAYLEQGGDYRLWLEQIRTELDVGDGDQVRRLCAGIMGAHASTRERLPILDNFYATTLASIAPIRSAIDIACGLNPLAIPWMPLAADAEYYAYDIYDDMMAFLRQFMELIQVRGRAETRDVIRACPTRKAELALVLKAIPCLEQIDRSAPLQLLERLQADYLLVSFPIRSLGGRNKGMATNYELRFHELVDGKNWSIQRFEFATELAFLVEK